MANIYGNLFRPGILTLLIIACCSTSFPQEVNIAGTVSGNDSKEVALLVYDDYITYSYRQLNAAIIDENGSFKLKCNINQITTAFLRIENTNYQIFLVPGMEYEVRIGLAFGERKIVIVGNADGELNASIAKFDSGFALLTSQYYPEIIQGVNRKFIDSVFTGYTSSHKKPGNAFLNSYVDYNTALLRQIIQKNNKTSFENEYIKSRPVLESHPSYMNFMNQYFPKYLYLQSIAPGGEKTVELINNKKSYEGLMSFFAGNETLANDTLRELLLLMGLYEVYGIKDFRKDMIVDILDSIALKTQIPNHKKLANNIKGALTAFSAGAKAPEFILLDQGGNRVVLKDFEGKYVYLNFWAEWCLPCLQDLKRISDLADKYGEKVAFVNICLYTDKNKLLSAGSRTNEYFLHYDGRNQIKDDYNVYHVPSFFLLDKQGKFINAPAEPPGSNIETIFYKLFTPGDKGADISDPGKGN